MIAGSLATERIERRSPVRLFRKAFSFPAMLCGLLVVLAVLTVRSRFDDPDMWWHLKLGEIISTTHQIPASDNFSYTTGHHAYVAHEWLSQVLIYGAYRAGAYGGLMVWLCLFTSALLIGGYLLCWLYSGNAKISFLGALVIWLFATVGYAIRPQMVGYLFLVVELTLIQLGRSRSPRWFLGLPVLFAVWVNCHGSFFLGMVVGAAFLCSSFVDFEQGLLVSRHWDLNRRKLFGWCLAGSVAALFVNPVGLRQVLYPLDTLMHQPVGLSQVEEWQPLVVGDGRGLGFLAVLLGLLLVVIVRREPLFLHELLLIGMGAWLAAGHRRMLFVFGILVAPVLSRVLSTSWEGYDAENDHPVMNGVFLAVSLSAAVLAVPSQQALARQVEEKSPVKAVEFIKAHGLDGPMVNEYVFGGYLIWAAPEHPVFVDGRADVFEETGVLSEFGNWATLQSDPRELLDKYHVTFCLMARRSPMANVLPLLPGWKGVYTDQNSMIFVRDRAEDKAK